MSVSIMPVLMRWRGRLIPESVGMGWTPFLLLGYLVFLFLPAIMVWTGDSRSPFGREVILWPTILSIIVFLPLYFFAYRQIGARRVACMLGIAALGYALLPTNAFANTYLTYAVAFAATLGGPLWKRVAWMVGMLGGLLLEVVLLHDSVFIFLVTTIVSVAVFFGNHHYLESRRKQAALQLSHDEVRRLAALAERERIGRDLHDLLGHTLSLVALKSELAGKLVERDPQAAQRELVEVTRVARDALSQVRSAVTGIRAAGVASELASARLLLETDGVTFAYEYASMTLPSNVETVLAMTLREAVTNIQRHARARGARARLAIESNEVVLRVEDDGRGGAITPGNGLSGMRERLEALGGRLRIDSVPGHGTRVQACVPVHAPPSEDARADAYCLHVPPAAA